MIETTTVKALRQLKANIETLLAHRREDQTTLARWCGHSKAWINKFLNNPETSLQIRDLDKIADFFGIATYQLFQPGISHLTERRKAGERRAGRERRIGHQGRHLATLRTALDKLPHGGHLGGVAATRLSSSDDPRIQRVLDEADAKIAAIRAGGQAPAARPPRSSGASDHRKHGRPAAK